MTPDRRLVDREIDTPPGAVLDLMLISEARHSETRLGEEPGFAQRRR
jgi:hypothetical protein